MWEGQRSRSLFFDFDSGRHLFCFFLQKSRRGQPSVSHKSNFKPVQSELGVWNVLGALGGTWTKLGMNVEWNKLLGAREINLSTWWIAAEETVSWLSENMGRNEETGRFFPCLFFFLSNSTGRYTRDKLVSSHSCLLCKLSPGCKEIRWEGLEKDGLTVVHVGGFVGTPLAVFTIAQEHNLVLAEGRAASRRLGGTQGEVQGVDANTWCDLGNSYHFVLPQLSLVFSLWWWAGAHPGCSFHIFTPRCRSHHGKAFTFLWCTCMQWDKARVLLPYLPSLPFCGVSFTSKLIKRDPLKL